MEASQADYIPDATQPITMFLLGFRLCEIGPYPPTPLKHGFRDCVAKPARPTGHLQLA
jgi:hypothetical protein